MRLQTQWTSVPGFMQRRGVHDWLWCFTHPWTPDKTWAWHSGGVPKHSNSWAWHCSCRFQPPSPASSTHNRVFHFHPIPPNHHVHQYYRITLITLTLYSQSYMLTQLFAPILHLMISKTYYHYNSIHRVSNPDTIHTPHNWVSELSEWLAELGSTEFQWGAWQSVTVQTGGGVRTPGQR